MNQTIPDNPVVLTMQGVYKSFGASYALNNVSFELLPREIHGLLGGNGAGKTTLMNILFGLYREDAGIIKLHGEKVTINSPKDAIDHRIGMVHQHFLQVQNFNVLENITLGIPGKNRFSADYSVEEKSIHALMNRFGLTIDLNARIEELTIGARQKVEILKALYRGVEILILDEPTTNLTPQEVDDLFKSLREMVNQGMSIVFITHKLREVLSVCDRITVLRNGQNITTLRRGEASEESFIRAMVGDEMNIQTSVIFTDRGAVSAKKTSEQEPILELKSITLPNIEQANSLKTIDLAVYPEEIVGVAGVAENGQRELVEAIMQIVPPTSGKVLILGEDVTGFLVKQLFEKGVSYIPEDRIHDGFLPRANVAQNLILGWHKREPYSKNGFINWPLVMGESEELITKFNIKTQGADDVGANLSGGNIQRVMIARALTHLDRLLIAHNPTRGLDIPSMDFFYSILLMKKEAGVGTIFVSENLDELLLLCDRIAVLYRGEIMGTLERGNFEKYELGRMMSGIRTNS